MPVCSIIGTNGALVYTLRYRGTNGALVYPLRYRGTRFKGGLISTSTWYLVTRVIWTFLVENVMPI